MLGKLLQWMLLCYEACLIPLRIVWNWAQKASRYVWLLATAAISLLLWVWQFIIDGMNSLLGQVAALAVAVPTGTVGTAQDVLDMANFALPVAEMLSLLALLMSIKFVGLLYRFVKSWIPTMS